MKKVYLASPFFNDEEIKNMEIARDILRGKGLEIFVPNEHQNPEHEFGSFEWRKATFEGDLEGIDTADVVVAVINQGNYDDSGTAWEIGYAYANNIPIIVVNFTGKTINLMIADSLHALITSEDELRGYDFTKLEKIRYTNYVW